MWKKNDEEAKEKKKKKRQWNEENKEMQLELEFVYECGKVE